MKNNTQTTRINKLSRTIKEWLPPIALFIGVIVIWQLYTDLYKIPSYILPKPGDIANEFGMRAESLLVHLSWTMRAAMGGFILGTSMAFFSAVVFVHSHLLERSLYPWAIVFHTIPIVAIAPLLTIWMGFGMMQKVAVSAIICYFPMLVNSVRGLRSVSPPAMELMQILSANKLAVFTRLRLPSSLPYLFTGLKVSSTLSVVGAIVGEFTGSDYGIGKVILVAQHNQMMLLLFAGLVYTSLAAIVFFLFISLLEKLVIHWNPET